MECLGPGLDRDPRQKSSGGFAPSSHTRNANTPLYQLSDVPVNCYEAHLCTGLPLLLTVSVDSWGAGLAGYVAKSEVLLSGGPIYRPSSNLPTFVTNPGMYLLLVPVSTLLP